MVALRNYLVLVLPRLYHQFLVLVLKAKNYDLPKLEETFGARLKKRITDIQTNKAEDPFGWRIKVC